MAFNKLAAGRKVYSNGSHAPHRGKNDKRGYLQRTQRQKLAQKAAKRRQAKRKMVPKKPVKTSVKTPVRPAPVKTSVGSNPHTGAPRPQAPVGAGAPATPPAPTQPANPYVEINSNGQLDLPYNTQYSWDVLQQTEEMNQSLLELQQEQQQQAMEYQTNTRDLDQQSVEAGRGNLNTAAARGVARSSTYGNQVARTATQFNNARSGLEANNNMANQNFTMNRSQIANAFNNMLRKAGLANAEAQSVNAGKLGFGNQSAGAPPVPKFNVSPYRPPAKPAPKPKSKPKGKGKVTAKDRMRKKAAAKRRQKRGK